MAPAEKGADSGAEKVAGEGRRSRSPDGEIAGVARGRTGLELVVNCRVGLQGREFDGLAFLASTALRMGLRMHLTPSIWWAEKI